MQKANELNDRVIEWLRLLKSRPGMVISSHASYGLLQNYIEGYIDGLSLLVNKNMRLEITRWYQKKLNVQTNYYWTGYIPFHFTGKNDEELKEILLNVTEEYFREHPAFHISS